MTLATPTDPIQIPLVGQPWPDDVGITYAGIMRAGDIRYHLQVSSRETDRAGLKWGPNNKKIKGANSTWDGLANTRALLASGELLPAAFVAAGEKPLADDGWYLPSQRELALCWATVPEIFETDDWYWSSTQYSANYAWVQSFACGSQTLYYEPTTARVRLVRRLIIQ